jgi:sugar-phosphatase
MRFRVEAILFDIDGTLVDSTGAVVRTWRKWAAAHGLDAEDILRVCHGRRSEDTIAEFLPAEQQAAAVAEMEALELSDLDDVVALPATQQLLQALPRHRWAAVTSGSRQLMEARLAAAGLPVPEVLVSAEDVSSGKPDPRGLSQGRRGSRLRHRPMLGRRGRSCRRPSGWCRRSPHIGRGHVSQQLGPFRCGCRGPRPDLVRNRGSP